MKKFGFLIWLTALLLGVGLPQVRLRFAGIPGRIYYVERAHSVTGPWLG